MTTPPPTPARERELFLGALALAPAERPAYLQRACGDDPDLRQRVDELLQEHAALDNFLETPVLAGTRPAAGGLSGTEIVTPATEKPGDRIGRYKLLQQIGEGGCGVVYLAEQEEPVRRRVALKVIKLGMDTRSVIARFEAERQALAMMDHPNIAKIFDAGVCGESSEVRSQRSEVRDQRSEGATPTPDRPSLTSDFCSLPSGTGRPFFVMELVRGIRITEYCDQNHLATEERLKLFVQVCLAIQHAHQKGVIHRDIKPSNILVTLHDGVPVPKVIDFGIAKATDQRLTDKTLFTEFTAFIGTPAYMSPEQAEMSGLDIDTRSDIYALGVLLYELLTGQTPFDPETLLRAGLDECRRTIREDEPARPSTAVESRFQLRVESAKTHEERASLNTQLKLLSTVLRGDLDWIVMKCIEKDRTRRYPTANGLAADVQNYLDGEPVLARPPSNVYRLRKLVRRHRAAFAATAGIAVVLMVGIAVSTWQAVRARKAEHRAHIAQGQEAGLRHQAESERERAEGARALARLNEYVADINLAHQALAAGNLGRAVQLLNKHRPQPGEPDRRGFEWRYLWQLCQGDEHIAFPSQAESVQAIACSPGGEWLVVGLREKLNVYDTRTRSLVTNLGKAALSLVFFPDGRTLAAASPTRVRLWNTADWSEQKTLFDNTGPLALSPDATRLATLSREGVRIWDTTRWTQLRLLSNAFGAPVFSPDGRTVAADARAGLTLWPLDDAKPEVVLPDSTNLWARPTGWSRADRTVAFSPDGRHVVAARNSVSERGVFVLSIWDTATGHETVMPDDPDHIEHTGAISALVFSPDGRTLATASYDHSIRLWDFARRQRLATLQGHLSEVTALTFTPDGQALASGAKEGAVKWWPTRVQSKEDVIAGTWQPLAFSPDSRTLAALNRDRSIVFLNLTTREAEQQFPWEAPVDSGRFRFGPPSLGPGARSLAVSADLRVIVRAMDEGGIWRVNTATHETNVLKTVDGPAEVLALSPDGRWLVAGGRGRSLRWWNLRTGAGAALDTEAQRILFSPEGRTLAVFQRGEAIGLWDVATWSVRTQVVADLPRGLGAAFSPDGKILATVGQDDAIQLWSTTDARLLGVCTGHKQSIFSVAFTPDGRTLASTSDDSTLKFWSVANQQELLTLRRLGGAMREMLFSPDGRMLVGSRGLYSRTSGLRFYRAPSLEEIDRASRSP